MDKHDIPIEELQEEWSKEFKDMLPESQLFQLGSTINGFMTSINEGKEVKEDKGMEWRLWLIVVNAYQTGVSNQKMEGRTT